MLDSSDHYHFLRFADKWHSAMLSGFGGRVGLDVVIESRVSFEKLSLATFTWVPQRSRTAMNRLQTFAYDASLKFAKSLN